MEGIYLEVVVQRQLSEGIYVEGSCPDNSCKVGICLDSRLGCPGGSSPDNSFPLSRRQLIDVRTQSSENSCKECTCPIVVVWVYSGPDSLGRGLDCSRVVVRRVVIQKKTVVSQLSRVVVRRQLSGWEFSGSIGLEQRFLTGVPKDTYRRAAREIRLLKKKWNKML